MCCGLKVRRKGSVMVPLDRATATSCTLSKVTMSLSAAVAVWLQF